MLLLALNCIHIILIHTELAILLLKRKCVQVLEFSEPESMIFKHEKQKLKIIVELFSLLTNTDINKSRFLI